VDDTFIDQLSPVGHISDTASAVWALGILPAAFLVAILLALAFWWRARTRALSANVASFGTIVHGRVERDDEQGAPISISIAQLGKETRTKNGWTHRWKETTRSVTVRPFYLRTEDGRTIRVEPDDRVFLVDGLDETSRSLNTRQLVSQLTAGEQAYVIGRIEPGFDPRAQAGNDAMYRGAGTTMVLRPPTQGRMLVSTEPLADRFARRARFHIRWALALFLVGVVNQVWFIPYFHRAISGEVVQARITDKRWWTTRSRNGTNYHYAVSAEILPGEPIQAPLGDEEVSRRDYNALEYGARVPYLVATDDPSAFEIGQNPTTHCGLLIGAIVVALGMLIGYASSAHNTLPWYDRKRVVHSGGGMLYDSPVLRNSTR
jgi:hypothetical protein